MRPDRKLLDWLTDPVGDRGLSFLTGDGWQRLSYPALADKALSYASLVRDMGIERGGRVLVLHDTGPEFVGAFFGALAAGCTAVPLAPPRALGGRDVWVEHAGRVIELVRPDLLLGADQYAGLLADAARRSDHRCVLAAEPDGHGALPVQEPPEVALLQFTSGSRGSPRAVQVTGAQLAANISSINVALGAPDDFGASWLPFYHDMGLVGCLLFPIVHQVSQRLMSPSQFIGSPLDWLSPYGGGEGQVMAMPNFGFDYVARKVAAPSLTGMDFSRVEVVISAAERVRAASVAAFYELLRPFGLRWEALQPMYGLAEATLAVSGVRVGEIPITVAVRRQSEQIGAKIEILDVGTVDEPGPSGAELVQHVSCGVPLRGVAIKIVDDAGRLLPPGHLGEIVVSGPGVAKGYLGESSTSTRFTNGNLFTGDVGFCHDGELFVLGRQGDSIKVRGRSVYVEEIEEAIAATLPQLSDRTVVVAGTDATAPTILLLTEHQVDDVLATRALDLLRSWVGDEARVDVVVLARKSLQFTSSGKPRRSHMWQRHLTGELPGVVVGQQRPDRAQEAEGAPHVDALR
ncbi:AMP-binding protein [Micromonospora auratinigra]|uniref:Acyl-CoA synthetase (AMP-forming)/AMP-acid ligase II n=1 Tax=Micromonospora auratinigra TaxID=261654 RepID=A0A1A8Z495_9ACTN|nr:AMP-binding protein [Micromonospora auratinigra]SBT38754.1 Acyl-CoA synthetase (AMP-forming)/AMP-acid ligase II [Micromonospora auratinigra]